MAKELWSELSDQEKLDRLAKVITRAGADAKFRADCLDRSKAQKTIEDEADVTFDKDMTVRCLPDKAAAEKEIMLLLPETPAPPNVQYRPEEGFWLCTYSTYNPNN